MDYFLSAPSPSHWSGSPASQQTTNARRAQPNTRPELSRSLWVQIGILLWVFMAACGKDPSANEKGTSVTHGSPVNDIADVAAPEAAADGATAPHDPGEPGEPGDISLSGSA